MCWNEQKAQLWNPYCVTRCKTFPPRVTSNHQWERSWDGHSNTCANLIWYFSSAETLGIRSWVCACVGHAYLFMSACLCVYVHPMEAGGPCQTASLSTLDKLSHSTWSLLTHLKQQPVRPLDPVSTSLAPGSQACTLSALFPWCWDLIMLKLDRVMSSAPDTKTLESIGSCKLP